MCIVLCQKLHNTYIGDILAKEISMPEALRVTVLAERFKDLKEFVTKSRELYCQ